MTIFKGINDVQILGYGMGNIRPPPPHTQTWRFYFIILTQSYWMVKKIILDGKKIIQVVIFSTECQDLGLSY